MPKYTWFRGREYISVTAHSQGQGAHIVRSADAKARTALAKSTLGLPIGAGSEYVRKLDYPGECFRDSHDYGSNAPESGAQD